MSGLSVTLGKSMEYGSSSGAHSGILGLSVTLVKSTEYNSSPGAYTGILVEAYHNHSVLSSDPKANQEPLDENDSNHMQDV